MPDIYDVSPPPPCHALIAAMPCNARMPRRVAHPRALRVLLKMKNLRNFLF